MPGGRAAAVLADLVPILAPPPGFRAAVAPPAGPAYAHVAIYDLDAALSHFQRDLEGALRASVAYVDHAVRSTRPDVVVVDQITVAAPVARGHGLPVVQVTHAPLLPGHDPWMHWLSRRPAGLRHPPALPALARACTGAGLPPPETLDEQLQGEALAVPTHPGLGTAPGALHVRAQDSLGPVAPAATPPRARSRRPRVAVQLSLAAEVLAAAVLRGVLATGAEALALDLDPAHLPDDLRRHSRLLASGPLEMQVALAGCDAAVHHGGSGTAMACLAAGVPAVAVPSNSEREHTARALEALGAGRMVEVSQAEPEAVELRPGLVTLVHREPRDLEERLAAALHDCLQDGARRERARELAGEVARLPGVDLARDSVERLAVEAVA